MLHFSIYSKNNKYDLYTTQLLSLFDMLENDLALMYYRLNSPLLCLNIRYVELFAFNNLMP